MRGTILYALYTVTHLASYQHYEVDVIVIPIYSWEHWGSRGSVTCLKMPSMRKAHKCSVNDSSCHVMMLSGHDRTWQVACGTAGAGLVPRAEQEAGTSSEFRDWRRAWKEQGKARAGMQMGRGCGKHSPGDRQRLELSWQSGPRGGQPQRWEQARLRAGFRAPLPYDFPIAGWHQTKAELADFSSKEICPFPPYFSYLFRTKRGKYLFLECTTFPPHWNVDCNWNSSSFLFSWREVVKSP